MKKFFMILGAVALSMSILVSCGKDNKPGEGTIIDDGGNGGNGEVSAEASLKGSAYIPFILDGETAKTLGNKIVADMRPDDVNKFLYVWSGTYTGAEAPGLNFYGEVGYTSMKVGTAGWSGAGFFATSDADTQKKFTGKGWTLHIAYKGPANVNQFLVLTANGVTQYEADGITPKRDGNGNVIVDVTVAKKICIGQGSYDEHDSNGAFVATHTAALPNSGSFVPNEWNEYEFDLTGTEFFSNGLSKEGCNLLTLSSGGVQDTPIMLDAVFLYKK